jgi:hypothetical protein
MANKLALVLGIILVLVGVLGFVPNPVVGIGAIFHTNMVLNIVYIVLGIVLVGCALRMPAQASLWLKVVGVVYLLMAVLGFLMVPSGGAILGLVETSMATHLLHAVVGVVLVVAGFVGKGAQAAPVAAPVVPPSNPPMGGAM